MMPRRRPRRWRRGDETGGAPWWFGSTALDEILVDIHAPSLIPLETVGLTARSSIADAIEIGRSSFEPEEQERFLTMLELRRRATKA